MPRKSEIPKDLEVDLEDIPKEEEPQAPEMPEKPNEPKMSPESEEPIEIIIKYEHLTHIDDIEEGKEDEDTLYFKVNVGGVEIGELNYNIEEEKIQTFGLEGYVLADDLIAKIQDTHLVDDEEEVFEEVDVDHEDDAFYKVVGIDYTDWQKLIHKQDHSDDEIDVFERGRTWLQTEEGKQYFNDRKRAPEMPVPAAPKPDYNFKVKRRIFGSNIVQYRSTKVEDANWTGVEVREVSEGGYKHTDDKNYELLKPGTYERAENVPQEAKKDIVDLYKKKIA